MPSDRKTAKVYFTGEEMRLVSDAAGAESVSGFIRRTVLNNLGIGTFTPPKPETVKRIQEQLSEFAQSRKVIDQILETENGVSNDQATTRIAAVPVARRRVAEDGRRLRDDPPEVDAAPSRAHTGAKERTYAKYGKSKQSVRKLCDAPVGPGIYCPKCGRRH